jgi:hypothetical protein
MWASLKQTKPATATWYKIKKQMRTLNFEFCPESSEREDKVDKTRMPSQHLQSWTDCAKTDHSNPHWAKKSGIGRSVKMIGGLPSSSSEGVPSPEQKHWRHLG